MKELVKRILRRSGFELRRNNAASNPYYQLKQFIDFHEIDLIFDVGANVGQFGLELRNNGYNKSIVSFEPLLDEYNKLISRAEHDEKWHIHPRTAIGAHSGETIINVSKNSVSSSILGINKHHTAAAAQSEYHSSQNVMISKIDDIAPTYLLKSNSLLLKIDTQGYEYEVLKGASHTIKDTKAILCELSLVELYEGQKDWKELLNYMEYHGFDLWSLQPGFCHPDTGQMLQADGIFVRRD